MPSNKIAAFAHLAAHRRSVAGAAALLFVAADAGDVVRFNQPLRPDAAEHGVRRHSRGCSVL